MKLRKLTLWVLFFLPILLLAIGFLLANAYYDQYLDRVSNSWNRYFQDPLSSIDPSKIKIALENEIGESNLSGTELTKLAKAFGNWLFTQQDGSLESFRTFRMAGIKAGDLIVSQDLCSYYRQFLGAKNEPSPDKNPIDPGFIQSLFQAQQTKGELLFKDKRLCLNCIDSIAIESIRASVVKGNVHPLNEFLNVDAQLSMESFTGIYEPVGSFRRLLEGLSQRSKTANVSFVVSSGNGNRRAYKCGLQFIWLPERKVWFPIELMVAWPGGRMPMEAFLL